MTAFDKLKEQLVTQHHCWLVTGVAGFIGSNVAEALLTLDQSVVGLDNFSTGKRSNLDEVCSRMTKEQRDRFRLIEGDIRNLEDCHRACRAVDFVLHHAALGSVPRSLANPILSNENNVTGFLNMLVAARENKVRRFIYASSSSVYGDDPSLPKREPCIGRPLSPYAVTKLVGELYANVFWKNFQLESIGLRYFNVFGPRQDPMGAYAAVIPRWISCMIGNQPAYINGDGTVARDFCYVDNVVQANLLAATTPCVEALSRVFNVAVGTCIPLNDLFELLRSRLAVDYPYLCDYKPIFHPARAGDIYQTVACIAQARELLGYEPTHTLETGLDAALPWYKATLKQG